MNNSITAIPGIEVGHWVSPGGETGCTVVSVPEPNIVAAEIRGAAPGTREMGLLGHDIRINQIQGIVLTGGSAFGLAAADGVMKAMASEGRGHRTPMVDVPLVAAAVIYDFFPEKAVVWPTAKSGALAYQSRSSAEVRSGPYGVGVGATVAKWRGLEHAHPGGLGNAIRRCGDANVGAMVALNAVGDIFGVDGVSLTGGSHEPGPSALTQQEGANTTLVVLATDARLTRSELSRLMVRAHDALAACIRPVHTRFDGDVVFAVSCGQEEGDHDALGEAAFGATAEAVVNAVGALA